MRCSYIMEKRKMDIKKDVNLAEDEDEKCTYTFVIPNSPLDELNISVKKDNKKEKKDGK